MLLDKSLQDHSEILQQIGLGTLRRMYRADLPAPVDLMVLTIFSGVRASTHRGLSVRFLSTVKMSKGLLPASSGKVDLSRSRKSASCSARGHFSSCMGHFLNAGAQKPNSRNVHLW